MNAFDRWGEKMGISENSFVGDTHIAIYSHH
jgi:hypothetical protein